MEFPETRRTPLVRTCTDTGEGLWNELLGILLSTGTSFDVVMEDMFADLRGEPGRTFRIAAAVLSGFPSPRAGFADHADHAELQPDRTFRGFC